MFAYRPAVLMTGVAVWVLWQTLCQQRGRCDCHGNGHSHHDETNKSIDTGHGVVQLEIFEDGVSPCFRLRLDGKHGHVEHDHGHHAIKDNERLDVAAPGCQDPHELAHAADIRRRFANREVTTGQIVVFGLTGGLIPCPASITVLLCLQLKKIALGATIVMSFSIGLALTMVSPARWLP